MSVVTTRTLQRKTLQFREKRCNFQKARAGEVLYACHRRTKRPRSLSVTDAAVLRTSMREEFPMKVIGFEEHYGLPAIFEAAMETG